jgi:iron complex outermembrane receptor protein
MRTSLVTVFVSFAFIASSGIVFADTVTTDNDPTRTGERRADINVIVTATRTEEDATSVPASVTVITGERIRESGKSSVAEVIEKLAGVRFRYPGTPAQAEITMRGFGENSHGRVLVCLDGERLNSPDMAGINWLSIPIDSIERIEIVRSGNGVFFGDNAVAGIVNIVMKTAVDKSSFNASASGGSYWFQQERGGFTVAGDTVTFRASGEHTTQEGFRERSAFRSYGGSAGISWKGDEEKTASIDSSYNNTYGEMPGPLSVAQMKDDPTRAANPDDSALTQCISIHAKGKLPFSEGMLADADASYRLKYVENSISSFGSFTDVTVHTFSLFPRITADAESDGFANRLICGLDGGWDILGIVGFADASRSTTTLDAYAQRTNGAAFVHDELTLADSVHLGAGARYDVEYSWAGSALDSSLTGGGLSQAFVVDSGIAYNPVKNTKLFARFSTLYRSPFIDEQVSFYGFGTDFFNADLEPETGWSVDAGAEASLLDGSLSVGVAAYMLDMTGEISFNASTMRNENMANTRHIGGDAHAELTIADVSIFRAVYSYTFAYFTAGANEDREIPLVSNHVASAEALIDLPFGVKLGGAVRYSSDFYYGGDNANEQPKAPGYAVVDLSLHYSPDFIPGKADVMIAVENLLNQSYATTGYYSSYDKTSYAYPSPPLTIKAGISIRL